MFPQKMISPLSLQKEKLKQKKFKSKDFKNLGGQLLGMLDLYSKTHFPKIQKVRPIKEAIYKKLQILRKDWHLASWSNNNIAVTCSQSASMPDALYSHLDGMSNQPYFLSHICCVR